jgi:glycosyltransferase involved in cell wall biosynthesis
VVVPVLDEAQALPRLLADLRLLPGLLERCVFVDNGSTDGSAAILEEAGARVVTEVRRGYGFACLAGVAVAREQGVAAVAFMEADGSDSPVDLGRLVGPVLSGDLDLVVGSRRRAVASTGGMPWHQRLGNRVTVLCLRLLFGLRMPDNGPFRAVSIEVLDGLRMETRAYAWTTEMLVKAHVRSARIAWVDVGYRERVGRSKIAGTARGTLGAFLGIFGTMLRLRVKTWAAPGAARTPARWR